MKFLSQLVGAFLLIAISLAQNEVNEPGATLNGIEGAGLRGNQDNRDLQGISPSFSGILVFKNGRYDTKGGFIALKSNVVYNLQEQNYHNSISSMKLGRGVAVVACLRPDMKFPCKVIKNDKMALGSFNNKISSITVYELL